MGRSLTAAALGAAVAPAAGATPAVDPSAPVTVGLALVAVLAVVAAGVLAARGRAASARAENDRARVRALTGRLEALTDLTGTGLLVLSSDGRVVEMGDRAARVLGLGPGDVVGRPVAELPVALVDEAGGPVHPGAVLGGSGLPGRRGGAAGAVVVGVAGPGGSGVVRRVRVESRSLPAAGRDAATVLTTLTEVGGAGGDRSGVALHDAAQAAPVALALADADGRVVEAHRAFAELAGGGLQALPDVDLRARGGAGSGTGAAAVGSRTWDDAVAALMTGARPPVALEQRWSRDGRTVPVVLDLALAPGSPGGEPRVAVVARDVTADRERSDQLTHRALHDPLTGLANRALLLGTLQGLLEQPGATDRVAVLACDLDGFKPINDRFGHAAGDDVLVHVAAVLRAATGTRGTVARLGGDEFVVVLDAADSARAAREVAAAIHAGLREPVRIQRHPVAVRASVGVALGSSPAPSAGAPGLLAAADAALYRAKGGGRSRTEVYDPAVDHDGAPAGLARDLTGALERGELVVHVQPVADLTDGQVVGEEALVRWQHAERGLLTPAVFGPAVAEAGLSLAVTRHLLSRAVDHLARTPGRWLAVDVEAELLGDGDLVRTLLADLAGRAVDPRRLVVELGGAAADGVAHRVRADLADLRAARVPVLLDRFGAGGSPLASLRDLPVDGIKLDPSFTTGVVDDPAAARVARAVGALAGELGLRTVAEGVDTPEQAQVLRDAGWRYGQGWAFGGPQPAHGA